MMLLRKLNYVLGAVILLVSCVLGGCTKVNQIEIPPPDFEKLVVETGSFKGFKRHETDAWRSQEDYVVNVITKGEGIYFQEEKEEYNTAGELVTNVYEYEVEFDIPKYKNAVGFTIPEQIINGAKFKGLRYEEGDTAHGYYEIESAEGQATNVIFFKVSISGVTWTYFLEAQ